MFKWHNFIEVNTLAEEKFRESFVIKMVDREREEYSKKLEAKVVQNFVKLFWD